VVSALQIVEGADPASVAGSWDAQAAPVVAQALRDLRPRSPAGLLGWFGR
jgi:thioesterase domain-containing protein